MCTPSIPSLGARSSAEKFQFFRGSSSRSFSLVVFVARDVQEELEDAGAAIGEQGCRRVICSLSAAANQQTD